ncbi:MAG: hypothetical protein K6G29_14055 [Clostridiales bacterium]|nr:hypothetical protein [Clostridiales bacterium]
MHRFRSFAALLVVLAMAAMLSGCIRIQKIDPANKPDPTDPDQGTVNGITLPGTDPESTEIPLNFDLDLLIKENAISTLLEWNDSVTVRRDYDGGTDIESYWKRDGERVMITESRYDDGSSYMAGNYRGFDFYVYEDDWTAASKWVTAEEADFSDWVEESINRYFPAALSEDMVITAEEGDYYTVRLVEDLDLGEGKTTPCVNTAVVNKGTLFLKSFSWEYYVEDTRYYGSFEVEYNGERLGMDAIEDWEGFRTITIDVLTEAGTRTETFEFPERWQLRCLPDEGIILTSPDGIEEEGTVLIDANTGAATVYARDEANTLSADPGGEIAEGLPFSLAEMMDRNRVTNLLDAFGSFSLVTHSPDYEQTTGFFRREGEIVQYYEVVGDFEGEELRYGSGSYGDYNFDVEPGGNITLYVQIPSADEEEYAFTDDSYVNDYYLIDALQFSAFGNISDIEDSGDAYSFRFNFVYDGAEDANDYLDYEVDKATLFLRTITYGYDGSVAEVIPSWDSDIPDTLDEAFADSRDIFVHYEGIGEVHYEVPASWAFVIGYFGEVSCWEDEACKTPMENFIPGDGENYEFWVTQGVG